MQWILDVLCERCNHVAREQSFNLVSPVEPETFRYFRSKGYDTPCKSLLSLAMSALSGTIHEVSKETGQCSHAVQRPMGYLISRILDPISLPPASVLASPLAM